jgi:hypothetical protein
MLHRLSIGEISLLSLCFGSQGLITVQFQDVKFSSTHSRTILRNGYAGPTPWKPISFWSSCNTWRLVTSEVVLQVKEEMRKAFDIVSCLVR